MNEKQKEQNIPASMPPDNNDKNIAPVKKWQLKSWQIALAGVIIQSFLIVLAILSVLFYPKIDPLGRGDYVLGVAAIFSLLFITILGGSIITLLLYFNKTRKLGAIISIIFVVMSIVNIIINTKIVITNGPFSATIIGFTIGNILVYPSLFITAIFKNIINNIIIIISFLLAGIYYFWKKV